MKKYNFNSLPCICGECGLDAYTIVQDDSFDHEFGTEEVLSVVSDCCGGEPISKRTGKEITVLDVKKPQYDG